MQNEWEAGAGTGRKQREKSFVPGLQKARCSGASGGGRGSSVNFYGPGIEYIFKVDGKQYTNRQISAVVIRSINRSEVEKFLEDFPAGAEIDVFHKPGKPSRAYLIPGSHQGWWVLLLAGLFFAVIGVLILTDVINIPLFTG